MDRRDFLVNTVAAVALAPFVAAAQPALPVIGYLSN
jgi:hypothetical protein